MKNGKFDKLGFMEMAKMYTGNDEKIISVAVEIGNECEIALKDVPGKCEVGLQLDECIYGGIKARNLNFDFI